jgi:tRNA(adenine34) deaminase
MSTSRGKGRRAAAPPDPAPAHAGFMRLALQEAKAAFHVNEVPIGAVAVREGRVVASGFNQPIHTIDPVAHAEIVALRQAARVLGNYRLTGVTLYVTVEPCLMCVGAMLNARISTLVYGADEPKFGAVRSILELASLGLNHRFEVVSGVLESECSKLLVDFFKFRREGA